MYDNNVFAVFLARDQRNMAGSAFLLNHNARWFRKAAGGVTEEPTIASREPTPAPEVPDDAQSEEVKHRNSGDRLVITFDRLQDRLQNGIQLGTDSDSHILLGCRGTKGISARHCNIEVDKNLYIWLHDYHSTHGTAVGHDSQNAMEVRRRDTWILAYRPGAPPHFGQTTIYAGILAMEVQFPNHEAAHPDYIKNLEAFVSRCRAVKDGVPPIEGLGLNSGPATQAASEAPTPGERLVYYKGKSLGSGQFGEVHMMIRARDGRIFAAKTFASAAKTVASLPQKRKREESDPGWLSKIRREFYLMREHPHTNVAQVFELWETPEPTILMAYYPEGNMVSTRLSEPQYMSGFGQVLEALGHLHGKGVVHRDLKPENFLYELEPFRVVISDFGMAKVALDDAWLQTFCGTPKYTAPEVFPGNNGHGTQADVWSLGVIGIEWIYRSPKCPRVPAPARDASERWHKWIAAWSKELRHVLTDEDEGADPLILILSQMVEFEARKRWSAKACLVRGLNVGLFKRRLMDGMIICADAEDQKAGMEMPLK